MEKLSRDERFRATVDSMNTLLVQKGIYSREELELRFRPFSQKSLGEGSRFGAWPTGGKSGKAAPIES
jgi:hypothetical protein